MSIPPGTGGAPEAPSPDSDSGPSPGGRRPAELAVRLAVPVGVALVFAAVLLVEQPPPPHDLQLVAPEQAAPGQRIALRALGLVDRGGAVDLAQAPVTARLVDRAGRAHARTELEPAALGDMEGELVVPSDVPREPMKLVATASLSGDGQGKQEVGVTRRLTIRAQPEPVRTRGRLLSPLQQLRVFPVEAVGESRPPAPFEPRVVGGACVPEHPCAILVWVGTPAARVAIAPTAAVEAVGETPRATAREGETRIVPPPADGPPPKLARLRIVVHGPEGEVILLARREQRTVARRKMRLPVAQGQPAMRLATPWMQAPARAELAIPPTPGTGEGVIVDGFREARWTRTTTLAPRDDPGFRRLPFAPLEPGLWRIQARPDPYGGGAAATRLLFVRGSGMSEPAALGALAETVLDRGWGDELARRLTAGRPLEEASSARQAAYMLAIGERELARLPEPTSGHAQAVRRAAEGQSTWRWVAAGVVVLLGLVVSAYMLRRGLVASAETRRVLAAFGDENAQSPARRTRTTLHVTAVAALLVLVFVAVAAMILARNW